MRFIVKWGDNHKKTFANEQQAREFAYQKAFCFTVLLNGAIFERKF